LKLDVGVSVDEPGSTVCPARSITGAPGGAAATSAVVPARRTGPCCRAGVQRSPPNTRSPQRKVRPVLTVIVVIILIVLILAYFNRGRFGR
jgi:hypothetical protein